MFYDVFYQLCSERHVTPSKACTEMGLSRSLAAKWKNTGQNPSFEIIPKIANYFGVSTSFLLGEEEKKPLVNGDEELTEYLEAVRDDPDLRMLFSVTKGATKKDIQDAIAIIQMLKSRDRGETL